MVWAVLVHVLARLVPSGGRWGALREGPCLQPPCAHLDPGPGCLCPRGACSGVSVSPWGARDANQLRPLRRGGFTGVWGPARPSLCSQDPLPLRLPLPVVLGWPRGQARHPHTWSHAPFPKACSPGSSRLRGGPQGQVGAAQGVRRAGAAGGVGNLNGGQAGRREGPGWWPPAGTELFPGTDVSGRPVGPGLVPMEQVLPYSPVLSTGVAAAGRPAGGH